jgi:hypothetical protein
VNLPSGHLDCTLALFLYGQLPRDVVGSNEMEGGVLPLSSTKLIWMIRKCAHGVTILALRSISLHYPWNHTIQVKSALEHKFCVSFFSKTFVRNIFQSDKRLAKCAQKRAYVFVRNVRYFPIVIKNSLTDIAKWRGAFKFRTLQKYIQSYCTENTLSLHYKKLKEIIVVYCENHMKHIHILCGQNEEIMNVMSQQVVHIGTTVKG